MPYLLGLDIGTTNIKAIAFDEEGCAVARAGVPTPTVRQGLRQAVHNAEDLWQAAAAVVRQVVEALAPHTVQGVAVASMGEEGFPLDAAGTVLYPGILWYDDRTLEQVEWWRRQVGEETIYRITGLPLSHTFTALKIQWLHKHEPDIMRRAKHWLGVSEYIAYRFSGAMATTPSLASRTMLYGLAGSEWSQEMLDLAGIPPELMPEIVESGTVIGKVSAAAADLTGLPEGIPVAAGGHDHICGFLAAGAIRLGDMIHSGGTAEAIARIEDREAIEAALTHPSELACGAHVLPGLYYRERGRQSGGVIQWWVQLLGGAQERDALFAEATRSTPGANGLIFVPYMFGKGPPGANPTATGSLLGLTAGHTRGDVLRSVIEGVCFDAIRLQRLLHPGADGTVTAIGGLVNNRLWLRLKANTMDMTVQVPEQPEAVAQGAALLAGMGTGVYTHPADMLHRTLRLAETVHPDPELAQLYAHLYEERYLPAAMQVEGIVRRG